MPLKKKASSTDWLKRLENSVAQWQGQAKAGASSKVPQYHHADAQTAALMMDSRAKNLGTMDTRPTTRSGDNIKPARLLSIRSPISP
jgi:hypothetical protein